MSEQREEGKRNLDAARYGGTRARRTIPIDKRLGLRNIPDTRYQIPVEGVGWYVVSRTSPRDGQRQK